MRLRGPFFLTVSIISLCCHAFQNALRKWNGRCLAGESESGVLHCDMKVFFHSEFICSLLLLCGCISTHPFEGPVGHSAAAPAIGWTQTFLYDHFANARRPNQADAWHEARSKWHRGLTSRGEGVFRLRKRQCNNASYCCTPVMFIEVVFWGAMFSCESVDESALFCGLFWTTDAIGRTVPHHRPNNRR